MSRHEDLTAVRAKIAEADDRSVRDILLQLTYMGVSPEAFNRAFEASVVTWKTKERIFQDPEPEAKNSREARRVLIHRRRTLS